MAFWTCFVCNAILWSIFNWRKESLINIPTLILHYCCHFLHKPIDLTNRLYLICLLITCYLSLLLNIQYFWQKYWNHLLKQFYLFYFLILHICIDLSLSSVIHAIMTIWLLYWDIQNRKRLIYWLDTVRRICLRDMPSDGSCFASMERAFCLSLQEPEIIRGTSCPNGVNWLAGNVRLAVTICKLM